MRGKHVLPHPVFPNWNAHSHHVKEMLGIVEKKLPREGLPWRKLHGIMVCVMPFEPRPDGRKSSKHRVIAECPECLRCLSAGRLHQHVCDPEDVRAANIAKQLKEAING